MTSKDFEWEKIFFSMPEAVAVVDREFRFAWVNAAMEDLVGAPREKIIGHICHKLIHNTDHPIEGCLFERVKSSHRRESAEMEVPEKKKWLRVTVDPVFDGDGNLAGAIHYISDITAAKRLEEERDLDERRLGLLSRIGMLVLREPNIEAMLKEAMRDICGTLGLCRVAVRIFGEPEWVDEYCEPGFPPSDPDISVYRCIADLSLSSFGGNVVVNDIRAVTYNGVRREKTDRLRLGAFLGVPLRNGQDLGGYLYLCLERPHAWTTSEVAVAEAVARGITVAVHHSKVAGKQKEISSRLVSLMNNLPGVVYRGLRDWSLIFIGADVKRMTGYLPEELMMGSVSWRNLIHPDDFERVKQVFREAVRQRRKVLRVEYRVLHRDGIARWVADRRQLIYDEEGNFSYVDGLLLDVTERKEAEEKQREIERRFKVIADTAPDAIISADSRGRIVFVNPGGLNMFGYDGESLAGRELTLLIPERYRSAHEKGMARFLATGEPRVIGRTIELHGLRKDGTEFPLELSLATWNTGEGVFFTGIIRDITARKTAEEEIHATYSKLHSLVEASPVSITAVSKDGITTMWNPMAEKVFGWSREEAMGRFLPIIPEDKKEEFREFQGRTVREGGISGVETRRLRKDGTLVDVRLSTAPMRDSLGNIVGMVGILEDISGRKRMEQALHESEEQLRQSQKIEAVGRLAGGVAHDFNNLLTAIRGYSDLLLMKLEAGSNLRGEVEEIQKAGERASSLTRQLLAFSRKQVLQPKVLDLNAVVDNMNGMLRRLIGEDIDLVTGLRPALWSVKVDPGQIEQVIMNLAVNARDAMPRGGKVTIETDNVTLDDAYVKRHPFFKAGEYAILAISDTGEGMSDVVKKRLFEPFFTTKEKGKGTGLGLSTVYGIVKQSGGYIRVDSELGKGTAFKVYFPRVCMPADTKKDKRESKLQPGSECVLLVEDEDVVRSLIKTVLTEHGYTVLAAADGAEALKIGREYSGPIDLILTDVVMPNMGGRQAADSLAPHRPGIKVLYISGYTDDAIVSHGVLEAGIAFLQKPFTPHSLLRKVREVLDNAKRG
ncbi:MAG: PAS domain S-box protein [Deltaproteobacteria bacterium]|nr:PAS domain S-box protein [Deltaproteobacteria bacterium]